VLPLHHEAKTGEFRYHKDDKWQLSNRGIWVF
jgi:hypothetical protein